MARRNGRNRGYTGRQVSTRDFSLGSSAGALALTLLVGCGSDPTVDRAKPAPAGWQVSGGFVRAPDGRRAILRGANLAGAHKNAPYFGFHQPADYARVRDDWGMNTIRFLILWAGIEPEKGTYDDAYLDGVVERIGWAKDAGLNVVLDMHQDVYGEGFSGDGAPRWTCDEARYQAFKPAAQWFLNYLDPNVAACIDGFYASDELQATTSKPGAGWPNVSPTAMPSSVST